MPSSLTMVLPIASVCSTRPPVSVLVRAPASLPRGFSRKHGLADFSISFRLASQDICAADFHAMLPTRFHGDVQNPARLPFSVTPSVLTVRRRYRNIRLLCIGYASQPRLSSRTDPGRISLAQEPLGLRRRRFSRRSRYSCQHSHSHAVHRRSPFGFAPHGKLPYH